MTSWRAFLVSALVPALGVASSAAGAQRNQPNPKTYAAALAAWRGCFPTGAAVPQLPSIPDADDSASGLTVRSSPRGFHVEAYWGGQGTEAVFGGIDIDFEPQGCRALWARDATHDGALAARVRIGWANREAPTDNDIRALVAEPARPNDPAHAFPRVWMSHACPGGPDSELSWNRPIEGPIAPAQPWHPGAPRRPPPTFWSVSTLASIGVRAAPQRSPKDEEDEEHDDFPPVSGHEIYGIRVPQIDRPTRTFTAAGVELFEAEIPGRNGGRAIALRDRGTNRHRWLVVTRGCIQGTTVKWLGAVGTRIVGVTHSQHGRYAEGDAILIIDVRGGTAWAVRFPETIREAAMNEDGKIRASLAGSNLALRMGRAKQTLDLAPMLALIPAAP